MKRILYILFSVAMTAVIFGYLFSHVTPGEVLELLRRVDARGVGLFLLASLMMSIFRAWRYLVILRVSGHSPGRLAMFLVVLVRNTFSDLLPARIGTLVYIYIVQSRLGVPFGAATSSFALAALFDLMALAPLIIAAVPGLGLGSVLSSGVLVGLSALLAGGTIAVLIALPWLLGFFGRILARLRFLGAERIRRIQDALASVVEDLGRARAAGIYGRVMVLSLMVRIFKYASLYLFLFALVAPLGYAWEDLPVARVFAGLCAAEAAASLPVSGIAGFGAYEGAWAFVFRILLFPAQLAKMSSIAHHLFTQLYGYSLGAVALLLLLLPFRRRAAAASAAPRREPAAVFYGGIVALLLAFGASASGLYRILPASETRAVEKEIVGEPTDEESRALEQLASTIRAQVVYHRRDGVYMNRIGDPKPVRLVTPGHYARWSPDGRHIAFLQDKVVACMRSDGSGVEVLARPEKPQAVAWDPSGREVYFIDGQIIRAVDVKSKTVRDVVKGRRFLELDVAPDGRLVVTVRERGVRMLGFDPKSGEFRRIADGCSASFSPDGKRVTNNAQGHEGLALRDFETGASRGTVSSPPGLQSDNQCWSNRADWLAAKSEGAYEDIFVHYIADDTATRVTFTGDCDRPDLFVER